MAKSRKVEFKFDERSLIPMEELEARVNALCSNDSLLAGQLEFRNSQLIAENARLLEHIRYYSYCTRVGVKLTEADYMPWEEAMKDFGIDIP